MFSVFSHQLCCVVPLKERPLYSKDIDSLIHRYYYKSMFSMYLVLARIYSMKCLESLGGIGFILNEKSVEK